MIDWTKPIERVYEDGMTLPAAVLKVLPNGDAFVYCDDRAYRDNGGICGPNNEGFRNVPQKPREWWLQRDGTSYIVSGHKPNGDCGCEIVHVREVLP